MPKINNIGESTPTLIAHPSREALASDATTRILDVIEHVLTERTRGSCLSYRWHDGHCYSSCMGSVSTC